MEVSLPFVDFSLQEKIAKVKKYYANKLTN